MAIAQAAAPVDYKALFESLPVAALLVDEHHRIVSVNAEFNAKYCLDFVEATGKQCPLVVHDEQEPVPACPLNECIETGRPAVEELFDAKHDRWLESAVVPTGARTPDGDRIFLHTIRDITQEKRALMSAETRRIKLEALVEKRTAELQKASRARDAFMSALSHELRTPLNSVIGFSGTLLQGLAGELNEEQQRQISMIHVAGHRLKHMVDDILLLDAFASGAARLNLQEVRIADIIEDAVAECAPVAQQKGLDLTAHVAPEADCLITTDRSRLRQAVHNLLANAVRYTDDGHVSVDARIESGRLVVSVSDTGRGMDPDHVQRVFEQFEKGPTINKEVPDGLGLGLSAVRCIAQMLGGKVAVESAPGKGSVFELRLPLDLA
ncbi:MAG: hypothetical protein Kow0056_05430 [Coriobacteriia bacterium]